MVKPEDVKGFLFPLPARKLYGVGPKTEAALNSIGVKMIGDIAKQDQDKLTELFGKWGRVMHQYANGVDNSDLVENEEAKSIGREVTFEQDTGDAAMLKQVINDISENIYHTSKEEKYTFRTVVLKIRFEDFETHTKQKSFKDEPPLDKIKETATGLLSSFKSKKKIRLIGLRLTKLTKADRK